MANFSQNLVFCGLGTLSTVIADAGNYLLKGKSSIPTLTNGGGVSALLLTINQNSSPVYVGTAGDEGFEKTLLCAAGDALDFVWTSAAAPDSGKNVLKHVVSIGSGQ